MNEEKNNQIELVLLNGVVIGDWKFNVDQAHKFITLLNFTKLAGGDKFTWKNKYGDDVELTIEEATNMAFIMIEKLQELYNQKEYDGDIED